jgi:hypothetical protein
MRNFFRFQGMTEIRQLKAICNPDGILDLEKLKEKICKIYCTVGKILI